MFDLLMGEDFDLIIEKGDFKVGESTNQHQKLLLLMNKGEIKQFPTIGVGLNGFLLDDADTNELRRAIQEEFEADGMEIRRLSISEETNIEIDAIYRQIGGGR